MVPPEALIKVVREELPKLAEKHRFDYRRMKDNIIDWLLTAYYGPKETD